MNVALKVTLAIAVAAIAYLAWNMASKRGDIAGKTPTLSDPETASGLAAGLAVGAS